MITIRNGQTTRHIYRVSVKFSSRNGRVYKSERLSIRNGQEPGPSIEYQSGLSQETVVLTNLRVYASEIVGQPGPSIEYQPGLSQEMVGFINPRVYSSEMVRQPGPSLE